MRGWRPRDRSYRLRCRLQGEIPLFGRLQSTLPERARRATDSGRDGARLPRPPRHAGRGKVQDAGAKRYRHPARTPSGLRCRESPAKLRPAPGIGSAARMSHHFCAQRRKFGTTICWPNAWSRETHRAQCRDLRRQRRKPGNSSRARPAGSNP